MRSIRSLSRGTLQVIAVCLVGVIIASVYLQVLWADWVVRTLFHKDYNNWTVLLALFILELLTPKPLRGLSTIILLLMTLYIWCVI